MAVPPTTLYILYNADSTILGKLQYGYRKLQRPSGSQPACAACEITHGGFSLSENAEWKSTKAELEKETGISIVQLHRDEIGPGLKSWVQSSEVQYPAVVAGKKKASDEAQESFELVLGRDELRDCNGDPKTLAQRLRESNALTAQASL